MRRFWVFLASVLLLLGLSTAAQAAKRLALVFGNDAYSDVPSLGKAANDARAIEKKLKSLGFEVIIGVNVNRRDMTRKIQELASRIAFGDEVVFYYAGHGVQIGDANLLLATDIPATSGIGETYVRFEGFEVAKILKLIQHRLAGTTILILDACRDNPFKQSKITRAIGVTRGLTPIKDTETGTFIMYSADEGQQAYDALGENDNNKNSVFTRNLLAQMDNPDLELAQLAKNVQVDVLNTVTKRVPDGTPQAPFYVDRLFGKFFFHKRPETEEDIFWKYIKDLPIAQPFEDYLRRYPTGKYAKQANKKLNRLKKRGDLPASSIRHAGFAGPDLSGFLKRLMAGNRDKLAGVPVIQTAAGNKIKLPIFPNSSRLSLTDTHLSGLSCLELWLARNEIFQRNGHCFTTSLGNQYFSNRGCRTTSTNILKKPVEWRNVALIKVWEKRKRCRITE